MKRRTKKLHYVSFIIMNESIDVNNLFLSYLLYNLKVSIQNSIIRVKDKALRFNVVDI